MKKLSIKMKVLLSIIIVFAIILFCNKVLAATYENLTYEIDTYTREITITGCAEGATELIIPSEINGFKVTKINYEAFYRNVSLESVEIPSSVTSIGEGAFRECTNLKKVVCPSKIEYFGSYMFFECTNLVDVILPSNLTEIDIFLFYRCSSLKGINIPSTVTHIYQDAFYGCTSLSNIKLPDKLEYLGSSVFYQCTSLEEIEIPMTVTELSTFLFDGCSSLKKIVLPYTINRIENGIYEEAPFAGIPSDVVVYVVKDSYAHIYAINNDYNIQFYTTPLTNCSITGIIDQIYSGYNLTQNAKIKYGGYTLKNGTDYTVSYENNLNAGTANITITGKYAFSGTITKDFTIKPENISNCNISNIGNIAYTGNKIQPNVTVKYKNIVLEKDIDFTVDYTNNINIGTATVEITGKGNYTGTVRKNFKIIPRDISKCKFSSIANQLYTGNTIKPSITIKEGSKTLKNGKDYTISYKNNKKIGTATLTITGKGIYNKTKTINFKIVQVTSFKIKSSTTNSISLSWKKTDAASGYEIYSYNYSKKKWVYVGKTSGSTYTIKKLSIGNTYKYRIRAYKNVNGKKQYGAYTSSVKTTLKLPNTKITSLTTKNKKANLKWKKVSGASGYEVYMATSKNGKYTKVKTTSSLKYTKNNLRKNKKYYFKIRAYKKVSGKKVYSSYSSIKSIKVR